VNLKTEREMSTGKRAGPAQKDGDERKAVKNEIRKLDDAGPNKGLVRVNL